MQYLVATGNNPATMQYTRGEKSHTYLVVASSAAAVVVVVHRANG